MATTQDAVHACWRMHARIAHACTTIPQNFTAPELQCHAAEYRALTVRGRMSAYIHAFVIRNDPKATVFQRGTADALIATLVAYCRKHWRAYVDTILKKTRHHGFPLRCLSCGDTTRWVRCVCACMHVSYTLSPLIFNSQIIRIKGRSRWQRPSLL